MKIQNYLPTGPFWDRTLSKLNLWRRLGYWPNSKSPKSLNELFLHQKLNFDGDISLAKRLTDKVELKTWLNENGLADFVVPTIMIGSATSEFAERPIPARCVIKPTHSSGDVIIVNESADRCLEADELKRIELWLAEDYYRRGREPNYKDLPRRVIIEDLLLSESGRPPSDYKILCANGVPFMIQVDINRFEEHVRQLYNPDWKLLDYCTSYPRHPVPAPKPPQLERALCAAGEISASFPLCRVDFYFLDESTIKLGEVTFFPANCAETFVPRNADWIAGKLISEIFETGMSSRGAADNA